MPSASTLRRNARKRFAKNGAPSLCTPRRPDLPISTVSGDLEHNWPDLNEIKLSNPSHAITCDAHRGRHAGPRQPAELVRAKRDPYPTPVSAAMEYNTRLSTPLPRERLEGIAEVGVEIPSFNRIRGNAAASASLERANLEKQRVALTLRDRAATVRSIRQRKLMVSIRAAQKDSGL